MTQWPDESTLLNEDHFFHDQNVPALRTSYLTKDHPHMTRIRTAHDQHTELAGRRFTVSRVHDPEPQVNMGRQKVDVQGQNMQG
jgi:hypothetical protein